MLKENLKIRGQFKLKVYRLGSLVEEYEASNLITDSGFGLVQSLLSSAADGKHISRIAFGELVSGDPVDPTAELTAVPNRFDLTVGGDDFKLFDSVTFPTNRSVSFNWTLTGLEGNDKDISYFGLLNGDDELFAAKSRQPIAKTGDIVLEGTWILHY